MADFRITTNAGELEAKMIRRAVLLKQQIEAAERRNLEALQALAVQNSSGAAPSPDPSRPYSRRRPHPLLPPYIVNVRTGVFRASWQTSLLWEGGNLVGRLFNIDPKSVFFNGLPTSRMIARPILQNVLQRGRRSVFERATQAVRRALRIS